MYHWVRRISLILALVVVLVLLWGQIAARLDPYALAARQMSATLADNPDLPERLEGYARSAQGTRQALGTEWSHPAVLLIDILQWSAAWDDIQQWLSRFPGANGIANSLADLVREVAALDTALAQLTVIAPGAAPYYRQFQAQPHTLTPDELKLINDSSYYLTTSLRQVDKDATDLAYSIQRVVDLPQYARLVADLSAWQHTPLVGNFYKSLIAWQQFPGQLEGFAGHARADAITLDRVQKWYRAGAIADNALHALYVPQSAAWIEAHLSAWLWLLALCLGGAAGGWVGAAVLAEPAGVPLAQGQLVRVTQRAATIARLTPRRESSRPAAPTVPTAAMAAASLVCTWSNGQRRRLYLTPQGALTIGSRPTSAVRTTPGRAAGEQVAIRFARQRFYAQALDKQWPTATAAIAPTV